MSARSRLEAFVVHESDEDQAEYAARIDAVVAEALREGADEVWGMPAPDCSDMSSYDDAWESGAMAAAARLREKADDATPVRDARQAVSA